MKDMIRSKTPRQKNAAIFPATGMSLISNKNNFSNVIKNKVNDMIRSTRRLFRMPVHIKINDMRPHNTGSAVFI